MTRYRRDPERERQERERFVVLLHVWTLASDGVPAVARAAIARELGMSTEEAHVLVDGLIHHAMLAPVQGGMRVAVAPHGARYLRGGAGRRRSVRFPPEAP